MIDDLDLDTTMDFNVLISCDDSKFKVQFNKNQSAELVYNSTKLNMITDVAVTGSLKITSAGYTGKVLIRVDEPNANLMEQT